MVPSARKRATYADVLAAPEHMVAEIIDGDLRLSPRPALPHAAAATALSGELVQPFKRGHGGPGGSIILIEPEVHLGEDVLVPDLGGWRRERLATLGNEPFIAIAPNWVCEVLSPSTAKMDRADKLAIYVREGVEHVWLVDPLLRTLEILSANDGGWRLVGVHRDDARVRAVPFDAIELDLAILWADVQL
jgi:Uma2 family endonuclease